MDFLNDIKVYDDVLDKKSIEQIFQFLSHNFYCLARSNDAEKCDKAVEFLRFSRTEEELQGFKDRTYLEAQKFDGYDDLDSRDKYWTRIHKGDPSCDAEDGQLCEALYEALSRVSNVPPIESLGNVYTNMLLSMDRPKAHIDNVDPKNRTVMFYTNNEWHRDWGGETVFYDFDFNIIKSVLPKPGRVVSFDGRIPHSARPPVTDSHKPRYITVMKF